MEDLLTGCEEMSLLEMLRRNLLPTHPRDEEDQRRKIELITKHQDEFPSKIREVVQIAVAPPERGSNTVLWEIKYAVKQFFWGRPILLNLVSAEERYGPDKNVDTEEERYGPDNNVDTEEEVEVAARYFPSVLMEKDGHRSPIAPAPANWTEQDELLFPILVLTTFPRTVFFVPIVTKVALESNPFLFAENNVLDGIRLALFNNRGDCSDRLKFSITTVTNREDGSTIISRGDCSIRRKPSVKLDEACLSALIRMRKLFLLHQCDLPRLLSKLFDLWNSNQRRELLKDADMLGFFRTRFQLLLDWDSSLLKDYGSKNLLDWNESLRREYHTNEGFWVSLISKFDEHNEKVIDPIIRMICKHGLSYHPRELGFIFSQNYVHMYMRSDVKATRKKAMKRIYEIGREAISTKMTENKTIVRQWVYAVATNTAILSADELLLQRSWFPDGFINKKVSVDGLYALIRSDPVAALIHDRTS